ncbi:MAG: hypothetical protein OEY52_12815 [Gammaproteobacteria bacterium]|nr:hypothetical protein [Gammaproteobacteria bacterium]
MRIENRVIRRLAVTLLSACLVILPMSAHALGFGNIRIKSALNEPLDAEIELLSATRSDLKGLKIQLASREAFLRAGIERPGHLSQLQFSLKTRSNGRAYLKITTKDSIREPFLDFLLEMNWKNGRMLREYTVLLDPPDRMRQQPTLVESPQTESPVEVAKQETVSEQEQESPFVEQEQAQVIADVPAETSPEAEALIEDPVTTDSIAVAEIEAEPVPLAESVPENELAAPIEDSIASTDDIQAEEAVEADVPEPDPFAGEKFPRIPIKADKRLRKAEEAELAALNVEPIAEDSLASESAAPIVEPQPEEEPLAHEPQPEAVMEDTMMAESVGRDAVDSVTTKHNDKLWNIADSMRPDESISIYQVMMALLQSNPDAFVAGNVHRLKVGKVLRIEDPTMLSTMSKSQAAQEYIAQTQAWEDYRSQFASADVTPVQAESISEFGTDSVSSTEPASTGDTSGELVLAAPEGDNQTAGSTGDQQATVNNEVVILREEIRQALNEAEAEGNKNIILNERLRDLESQLQDLQRSITVQDDELATLQKQLSDVNQRNIEAEQAELVKQAEQQEQAGQEPEYSEIPGVVVNEPQADQEVLSEAEMLAKAEQESAAPETAVSEQQGKDQKPGFLENIRNTLANLASNLPVSPMILAIGGGVIVVLLLLMLLLMQRRRQAANFQESILSGIPSHEIMASEEASMETNLSGESSFLSDFAISGASALQGDDGDVDPLTEADVFMAYGRYEAAEERIQEAIKKDPQRQELRIKLLELYNTTKNKPAFEAAAQEMYDNIGKDASNPMWQKALVMGSMLAPENPLFSGAGEDATRIREIEDVTRIKNMPGEDENNDILDLGMDDLPADSRQEAGLDDIGLDLDFTADSSDEPSQALDFDFDASEETAQVEAPMDLDFNLDDSDKSSQIDVSGLDFELPTNNTAEVDLSDLDLPMDETAETELAINIEEEQAMDALDKDTAQFSMEDSLGLDLNTPEESLADLNLNFDDSNESSLGLTLDMDIETAVANQTNDGLTMEIAQPTETQIDMPTVEAEVDATDMADLDAPSMMDEVGTKLDLAKAYIDMGDPDGAKSILDEVMEEGSAPQQEEAKELLQQI